MTFRSIVLFFNLLLVALPAGHGFFNWIADNPAWLPPPAFVDYWQTSIRGVRVPMGVIGGSGVILTMISAWLARRDRPSLYFVVAAFPFLALAVLGTVLWIAPINDQILTWSANALPANWTDVRDRWWLLRDSRLIVQMLGFALLLVATLTRRDSISQDSASKAHGMSARAG